ncbi:hypothetical protein TRIATDRAFT_317557, partial [Trichoderma atroviride IMI 206040]
MREVESRSEKGLQLPTRIRRWRSYQPASNIVYENDLDADNTSQTPSTRPLRKGIELEFVNIAHPLDATSSATISNIRSHAARDIHATRRASALRLKGGERKIRMKVDAGGDSHLSLASPVNIAIPVYNGLLYCCARPITKLEQFLLDYYATSVIPNAGLWCPHGDEEALFRQGVKQYWLPFIITDSGLLAGIFLSSCRNLTLREHQAQADHDYFQIAMMYKVECIRSVNAAIAAERPIISEATIAKTLILCADEFLCKNLNATALHFEGMSKMIKLKG